MIQKTKFAALAVGSIGLLSLAQADSGGQAASQVATQLATSSLKNSLKDDAPDWLKRTDISVESMDRSKPTWSVETIQPLYQTANFSDTAFFQGRWGRRDNDNTFNLGLGYRHLLDDKTWLLGINSFYDTTTKHGHQRIGVGAEAIGQYVTLRTNYYNAISGEKTVSTSNGITTTEKALDGYDFEVDAPLPYMPWLRIAAMGYRWNSVTPGIADIKGNKLTLRGNLTPNISVEMGRQDDNFRTGDSFIKIAYNFGATPTNGVGSSLFNGIKPSGAFQARDLTKHTLDKVQRQNDIVVQTKRGGGGGITFGRSN